MSPDQIVRAWKDAEYGATLAPDAAALLPANPAGAIELDDGVLDVAGGALEYATEYLETLGCCQGLTQSTKCDLTAGYPWCTVFCFTIVMTGSSFCAPAPT